MKKLKKHFKTVIRFPIKIKDKISNKALNNFKSYALDKFIKSEYLRNTSNIIPLTLITTLIRVIINFLLITRIKTNIYLIDFTISTLTTIILSLSTPLFYDTISYIWKNDILFFTNLAIDNLWDEDGMDFFEMWKSRILGSIGLLIIILLFFVEITSRIIQEFIVQMMITAVVTDKLNIYFVNLIEEKKKNSSKGTETDASFSKGTGNSSSKENLKELRKSGTKIDELPSSIKIVEKYNPNKNHYLMIDEHIILKNGVVYSSDSLSNSFSE